MSTKFENFGSHRGWEIYDELFLAGKEKKWTNKGNDKQEDADSLLNNTKTITPNVCTEFQNPRYSSSWEIFDERKKYTQTDKQTYGHTDKHYYGKDENYNPLYTSYAGGKINVVAQ